MNALKLSKRALHLPVIALSLLVLSACTAIVSQQKVAPTLFTPFTEKASYLLKEALEVNEQESISWQLAAIQALTQEKKYVLANSVIEYLQKKSLSPQEQNDFLLLIADNQYAQNQLAEALVSVMAIEPTLLSPLATMHYLKLKAELQIRAKEHQAASDTLLILTPLLTNDEEKQQYNDQLFTQLLMLPPEVLNQYQQPITAASKVVDSETIETDVEIKNNELNDPITDDINTPDSNEIFAAELAKIEAEMNLGKTADVEVVQLTEQEIFIQGWYSLASIYQRYQFRTNSLIRAIDGWKLVYPNHPAIDFMPTQLRNIPESSPYQPNKVAVLLPLSGRFKTQAQALQYGMSHAFYSQLAAKNELNIEEEKLAEATAASSNTLTQAQSSDQVENEQANSLLPKPSLTFFDTNKMTMQEIAEQMYLQDIDFIVGPLLKPNLEAFLPLVQDLPVLALNGFPTNESETTESQGSSIHYAFPLSPENEAEQAAEIIFQSQHKKPLILAPNSNFGRRVAEAFEVRWATLNAEQQGDTDTQLAHYPAETHYFTSKGKFADYIAKALQTDKSDQRINQMKAIMGGQLETEARSRRDVDAIYMVSKRSELILLKPFIAVTISPFAKEIPLYASSRSHDSDLTNTQNKELSGLTFSDIAFLMNDDAQVNQTVQDIWPKQSFSTLRLFALGYDSYNLIEQLKQLQVVDGYQYQGLVGELTLDTSNTIKSKLEWAQYQQGTLVEVTAPTSSQ